MNVLVIFTGGTIGSTVTNDYIDTDSQKPYVLIEQYNKRSNFCDINYSYEIPYAILSENLSGYYLTELLSCVKNALKSQSYDGIIITHGSDTLQYSSCFLHYALGKIAIPILLVASNYVLDDERANGLDNFTYAMDFIRNARGNGVFVPYRNSDGITYVHAGGRVLPHMICNDNLFSINDRYYGAYDANGTFISQDTDILYDDSFPAFNSLSDESDVLRVHVFPGMTYPAIPDKTKGIIIESYHSGTINCVSSSFMTFVQTANSKNIPIYIVGTNPENDYASVKEWEDLGLIPLAGISPIAAYIKLWMSS